MQVSCELYQVKVLAPLLLCVQQRGHVDGKGAFRS